MGIYWLNNGDYIEGINKPFSSNLHHLASKFKNISLPNEL